MLALMRSSSAHNHIFLSCNELQKGNPNLQQEKLSMMTTKHYEGCKDQSYL